MVAKISVITPSNSLKWVRLAYESLRIQSFEDWEWILLVNGPDAQSIKEQLSVDLREDSRITVLVYTGEVGPDGVPNVGALKKAACQKVTSPFVVEFDHDDELAITCLEDIFATFNHSSNPAFVYSDAVRVHADGRPEIYGSAYGWEYTQRWFEGKDGKRMMYPVATHPQLIPQNVSKIYHAPDHVRAWRADAYTAVGGHDVNLKVCDDLDLMCKIYAVSGGNFYHINKVLYKYVIHGENTWLKNQALIETLSNTIYDRYIQDFSFMYWTRAGKACLDLGGGINPPKGWTSVDVHHADVTADLNERWPFADGSVGVIRAHDVIEHLRNPIHIMNEAYRCLAHGGLFLIEVPSTDGRGAWMDPSHISFWNSNSFFYYTKASQQRYILHLGVQCKFQQVRILNYFPSEWHKLHNIMYTKSHLAAIKHGRRLHGLVEV